MEAINVQKIDKKWQDFWSKTHSSQKKNTKGKNLLFGDVSISIR